MDQFRINFLKNRKLELLKIEKEQGFLWNKQQEELDYIVRCLTRTFNKQKEKELQS